MVAEEKNIYATTNHHGLGVEGRGGDAISVRLDAKADGLNDEEGTGGNSRAREEDEERVDLFMRQPTTTALESRAGEGMPSPSTSMPRRTG